MIYIRHRVNAIHELADLDPNWGVEIDLRTGTTGQIILTHDRGTPGDFFSSWLAEYQRRGIRGPIILNTKEDGLEEETLQILEAHGNKNFFFLDTTLPTLVKQTTKLDRNFFAVRVSRYEPVEAALKFAGKARYAWIDCFDREPLSFREIEPLHEHFELCLVSPELQGGALEEVSRFADLAKICQFICTKNPQAWKERVTVASLV